MTDALDLLVDALAVARATRLVTEDELTAVWRDKVIEGAYRRTGRLTVPLPHAHPGAWADYAVGDPECPRLATVVTCHWCASIWLAGAAVGLRALSPRAWRWLSRTGALSMAAVLVLRGSGD